MNRAEHKRLEAIRLGSISDRAQEANIKLQLNIVSFFDIDFERPAEVLADQCVGCASRPDRGFEILIHN